MSSKSGTGARWMEILGTLCVAAVLGAGACSPPPPEEGQPGYGEKELPKAPGPIPHGWIHLEHGVWVPVLDDVGVHLQAAHDDYVGGRASEAGREIRLAAAALNDELERASARGRERLNAAIVDLGKLADELESGNEVAAARFNKAVKDTYDAVVSDRWSLVSQQEWFLFVGRPDEHFHRAEAFFAKHDEPGAVEEIRKGAVLVTLEATRAEGEPLHALTDGLAALEALANEVEGGSVKDPEKLRATFAVMEQALAEHYVEKAKDAWDLQDFRLTGRELHAATDELDRCLTWMGEARWEGLDDVIRRGRDTAERLVVNPDPSGLQVEKAIEDVRKEIRKVGQRLDERAVA